MRGLLGMVVVLWAGVCLGANYRELTVAEKAAEGATHVVRVWADDLTNTTAGATQTVSVATIGSNEAVSLVSMKLVKPFTETNLPAAVTNLTVRMGDDANTTFYMTDTSLSASNAPSWLSVGTGSQKVYTAADTMDARFWSGATNTLAEWEDGEVWFYLRRLRRQ